MKLDGAVVLVTGGTSGLGLALARALQNKGVTAHVCARTQPKIREQRLLYHVCDVTDGLQVESLIANIGKVDILINAAGVWLEGDLEHYPLEQIDKVIDTNLKRSILTCRAVLPAMKQTGAGVIVNIISSAGLKARAGETVYAASKWGLRGFTESLREELKASGIRIVSVYPGGMATDFFEKAGHPKQNQEWMKPEEVAETVVYAIEHDATQTIDQLVINRKQS